VQLPTYSIETVFFSPTGTRFVTVGYRDFARHRSEPEQVRLWDTNTRKPISEPIGGESYPLAFSPDGKILLTASAAEIRIWDAATGKPIGEPMRRREIGRTLAFSPDGKTFSDGIRLWDVATRKPIGESLDQGKIDAWVLDGTGRTRTIRPERSSDVYNAVFSPDGTTLLTTSSTGAQLWDVFTGKPVGRPMPYPVIEYNPYHPEFVARVAMSPDGKTFVTGCADKVARLWQLPAPLEGDVEQIRLWVEVNTGQELDAGGAVVNLDAKTWRERWDRLQKIGGPPVK
jgi:WD40 repeat protein